MHWQEFAGAESEVVKRDLSNVTLHLLTLRLSSFQFGTEPSDSARLPKIPATPTAPARWM